MDRKTFIGSSDIAPLMGMSRWTTPLQLWSEKTGKVEPADLSDNEAVEMGNELEETVARMFTKRTGMKVRRSPKRYIHKKHAFMAAQVDRLVEGTDELLECKTASGWKAKEWEGEEIPNEYILQVMWQLWLTGRKIGHIACLIGGQSFVYKKIDADLDLFKKMEQEAISFWGMVQDKVPPMAMGDDNKFMVELFPQEENEEKQMVNELNDSIGLIQQLKGNIKAMKDEQDDLEAKVKQSIGDNLGIVTEEYEVTWKHQTANRLDIKNLKEDQPEIYHRYSHASESRVLRVKLAKK